MTVDNEKTQNRVSLDCDIDADDVLLIIVALKTFSIILAEKGNLVASFDADILAWFLNELLADN